MTLNRWSQTASENDNADSTIDFAEGQAPSSINGSARAVMAAVAKFRDDLSGNIELAGTATAFTATTNQVFAALADGLFFRARMNVASLVDPTLAVDGLTAKQILIDNVPTNVPTGACAIGRIYGFTYDATADGWLVSDFGGDALTSGNSPDLAAIEALAGTDGVVRKTAAGTFELDAGTTSITFVKDNNGIAVATGVQGDIEIPFACTITGATLIADATGSVVIDLWKDTYANYPPTVADTITASAKPTLSSAVKAQDTTLTGWATAVAAGDIIRVNVDSVATITRFTLSLKVDRFI